MAKAELTSTETQPKKVAIPKDTTVLVVEDNVSNFVLIARMLGYLGIHCEWKTSGYEVVEYADTLPRLDLNSDGHSSPLRGWLWSFKKDKGLRSSKFYSDCSSHCRSER